MTQARGKRYQLFKKRIDGALAITLPEALEDAQFVDFLDASTPRLLETVRPLLVDTVLQLSVTNLRVGIHFARTLKPFREKLTQG